MTEDLQFLSNEAGDVTAVVVPIDVWREIASELETQYLLSSNVMRERILQSLNSREGVPLDEVIARFGLENDVPT